MKYIYFFVTHSLHFKLIKGDEILNTCDQTEHEKQHKLTGQTPTELAIVLAGGPTQLARSINNYFSETTGKQLKLAGPHIHYWRKKNKITDKYVKAVENITGVPRFELRPDLFTREEYEADSTNKDKLDIKTFIATIKLPT